MLCECCARPVWRPCTLTSTHTHTPGLPPRHHPSSQTRCLSTATVLRWGCLRPPGTSLWACPHASLRWRTLQCSRWVWAWCVGGGMGWGEGEGGAFRMLAVGAAKPQTLSPYTPENLNARPPSPLFSHPLLPPSGPPGAAGPGRLLTPGRGVQL